MADVSWRNPNGLARHVQPLCRPDAAFRLLIEAHRGFDDAASAALNARLVLLLANHIGDAQVLQEAIERARAAADPNGSPTQEA